MASGSPGSPGTGGSEVKASRSASGVGSFFDSGRGIQSVRGSDSGAMGSGALVEFIDWSHREPGFRR